GDDRPAGRHGLHAEARLQARKPGRGPHLLYLGSAQDIPALPPLEAGIRSAQDGWGNRSGAPRGLVQFSRPEYVAQGRTLAVDPGGDIADGTPRVALRIPAADGGDRPVIAEVPAQVRGTVLVRGNHFHRAAGHFAAQDGSLK